MIAALTPEARADLQRVLDRAARRLLAERLASDDEHAIGATTRSDDSAEHDSAQSVTPLVEREQRPARRRHALRRPRERA
jgi:hypothetical protein